MPETEAAGRSTAREGAGARSDGCTDAPYRAEAARGDGEWHLSVQSLDGHPDRGEVDALVVTVTPREAGGDFPAADLDRALAQCGFTRGGDWPATGAKRTVPCRQARPHAAPPAPPPPPPDE